MLLLLLGCYCVHFSAAFTVQQCSVQLSDCLVDKICNKDVGEAMGKVELGSMLDQKAKNVVGNLTTVLDNKLKEQLLKLKWEISGQKGDSSIAFDELKMHMGELKSTALDNVSKLGGFEGTLDSMVTNVGDIKRTVGSISTDLGRAMDKDIEGMENKAVQERADLSSSVQDLHVDILGIKERVDDIHNEQKRLGQISGNQGSNLFGQIERLAELEVLGEDDIVRIVRAEITEVETKLNFLKADILGGQKVIKEQIKEVREDVKNQFYGLDGLLEEFGDKVGAQGAKIDQLGVKLDRVITHLRRQAGSKVDNNTMPASMSEFFGEEASWDICLEEHFLVVAITMGLAIFAWLYLICLFACFCSNTTKGCSRQNNEQANE